VEKLTVAPPEIGWNIFKFALEIHLEIKQKPTGPDDVSAPGTPVLGLRSFSRSFREFSDTITKNCFVGVYPVVTFNFSDPEDDLDGYSGPFDSAPYSKNSLGA